jgi:hypothetical protein
MASAGAGFGVGIKDFRAGFVFNERDALENFIDKGWDFASPAGNASRNQVLEKQQAQQEEIIPLGCPPDRG